VGGRWIDRLHREVLVAVRQGDEALACLQSELNWACRAFGLPRIMPPSRRAGRIRAMAEKRLWSLISLQSLVLRAMHSNDTADMEEEFALELVAARMGMKRRPRVDGADLGRGGRVRKLARLAVGASHN
jgi:hypothetical protein